MDSFDMSNPSSRIARLDLLNKSTPASTSTVAAYILLFFVGAYSLLQQSRLSLPPLPQLLWNGFVYIMPPSLVLALDTPTSDSSSSEKEDGHTYASSRTFAAKSQAVRRILGLDGTGLLTNVQRARSLSGLGSLIKRSPSQALPGLGNWDNSCYQNSILQGLSSLPSLYQFLGQVRSQASHDSSWSTNDALKYIIEELNSPKNSGNKMWTPPALKSMSSWQQQDAQEYYSKVIDEMEKEITKAMNTKVSHLELGTKTIGLGSLSKALFSQDEQTPEPDPDKRDQGPLDGAHEDKLSSSPSGTLKNPLEGLLAQRVGCLQCGFVEGLSLIPFNCLTVQLGPSFVADLRACLDDYTTLESITGVECPNCTLLRSKDQLEKLLDAKEVTESEELEAEYALSGPIRTATQSRLQHVQTALSNSDFAESTLSKKCMISSKNRVTTTKTKQAVIARAPTSLVIHVNRSIFDELTGMLSKNHAEVDFPKTLDLSAWCLGVTSSQTGVENWVTDPARSMLASSAESFLKGELPATGNCVYTLRAVVTHYGRHENGHYIAYRQSPVQSYVADGVEASETQWWRLSDEDVSPVSEEHVLAQGGVFMLFYEQVEKLPSNESKSAPAAVDEVYNTTTQVVTEEVQTGFEAQGQSEETKVDVGTAAQSSSPHAEALHNSTARTDFSSDTMKPQTDQHHLARNSGSDAESSRSHQNQVPRMKTSHTSLSADSSGLLSSPSNLAQAV